MKNVIKNELLESINTLTQVLNDGKIINLIERISKVLCKVSQENGNIFFAGNGGSAADSQHLAAELIGRFQINRKPIKAQALTTDTSILTSIGNDYSFKDIFKRQIEALGKKGDSLIVMSTSGNSNNIINLIKEAKRKKIITIGLTGGNTSKLSNLCDYTINIPSENTARIQEAHILIGHIICGNIEDYLFGKIKDHDRNY